MNVIQFIAPTFASQDVITLIRHEISSPEDLVYFPLTENPILLSKPFS